LPQHLLDTIAKMPGINAPALAAQLGISLRTAQRNLQKLKEEGKIIDNGAPKNGGYFILGSPEQKD
jgi:DeoR/GlpR family transcriptional regulator of sugar metabolism